MKTISFTITVLLIHLLGFTQENPWTVSSGESPWIEVDTTYLVKVEQLGQYNDSLVDTLTLVVAYDTITVQECQQMGFRDQRGRNSFWTGFAFCTIFSVGGFYPASIIACIPNERQRNAEQILKKELDVPAVSNQQRKGYKRGILGKRVISTIAGCLSGTIANAGLIVLCFILLL